MFLKLSQAIQGTDYGVDILGHNVCVYFRGFNVGVAHKLLNNSYIYRVFEEMGCKTVPEGVAGYVFVNFGFCNSPFNCFL